MSVACVTKHYAVNAFRGDTEELLAFDLMTDDARRNLAGFSVEVRPPGVDSH